VATRSQLQVPIESVPIGSRVPTKNPNRWEVDPEPEPDQATWAKLSITAEGSDGGIVDAEIIRPRSWILASGLCAGRMLPLNLPELEVSGLALVTAIDDCPPIAGGEGSVVTARFVTREVHVVASVDVLGADGTVETITGTTIHPVWSVDRQSWVPLAELTDGETLQGLDGLAVVLSVTLSRVAQPVYNIEVHGEHVYQVGELGLVVHNSGGCGLSETGHTLSAFWRTDAMNKWKLAELTKDITANGLKNPLIYFTEMAGKPVVLLGNNRLLAVSKFARQYVNDLRFVKVDLPWGGFNNADELIEAIVRVHGINPFR
jgi:hypothetical protein